MSDETRVRNGDLVLGVYGNLYIVSDYGLDPDEWDMDRMTTDQWFDVQEVQHTKEQREDARWCSLVPLEGGGAAWEHVDRLKVLAGGFEVESILRSALSDRMPVEPEGGPDA